MAAVSARTLFCGYGFRKLFGPNTLHRSNPLSCTVATSTKLSAAWNRDWKPGPYPLTPAEKEAAAAKYGLRVEDYEPYDPNEDPGYSDYPKIKWIGADARSPYEEFDYPHLGTNYKEVLHVQADQSTSDRYSPTWRSESYVSEKAMISIFLLIYFGVMFLQYLCEYYDIKTHMPVMPKHYPDNLWVQRGKDPEKMPAVVHYTFEPASSS